jgi:hypothetical protein
MLLCNHAEWLHNSRRRTACEISSYPGFGTKGKCETRRNHLPRARYITNLTEPGQVVTTHWHEEAEFTLITRGACLYHIDLVDYEVQEGDLLFIPPLPLPFFCKRIHRYLPRYSWRRRVVFTLLLYTALPAKINKVTGSRN